MLPKHIGSLRCCVRHCPTTWEQFSEGLFAWTLCVVFCLVWSVLVFTGANQCENFSRNSQLLHLCGWLRVLLSSVKQANKETKTLVRYQVLTETVKNDTDVYRSFKASLGAEMYNKQYMECHKGSLPQPLYSFSSRYYSFNKVLLIFFFFWQIQIILSENHWCPTL